MFPFLVFLAVVAWVTWSARGGLLFGLIAEFLCAFFVICAVVIGLSAGAVWFYRKRGGRIMPHGPLCAALCVGLLLTSITGTVATYLGKHAHDSEARAARAFVADMEPRLRAYFDAHGRFPETLVLFGVKAPTVYFSEIGYSGTETSFQFTYRTPDQFIDQWEYNSDDKCWIEN